jgi:hypothetical protein
VETRRVRIMKVEVGLTAKGGGVAIVVFVMKDPEAVQLKGEKRAKALTMN